MIVHLNRGRNSIRSYSKNSLRENSLPQQKPRKLPSGFKMDEKGNVCLININDKGKTTLIPAVDILKDLHQSLSERNTGSPRTLKTLQYARDVMTKFPKKE